MRYLIAKKASTAIRRKRTQRTRKQQLSSLRSLCSFAAFLSLIVAFRRFANGGGMVPALCPAPPVFQLSSQLTLARFNSDQLTSNWLKPGLTQLNSHKMIFLILQTVGMGLRQAGAMNFALLLQSFRAGPRWRLGLPENGAALTV
jgi:hypothetical protein